MNMREVSDHLPTLDEIESKIVRQTHVKAALVYQEQEQNYWNFIHNIIDLEDDPDYTCESLLMEGELFTSRVNMAVAYKNMQEIAENNNFIIGGPDGIFTVGNTVAYDGTFLSYDPEEWIIPPQPGDYHAIEKSQISLVENGEEIILLHAHV